MSLSDLRFSSSPRDGYKIHILDSYKVSKKDIDSILEELREVLPTNPVLQHRSDRSLRNEWLAHNLLYKLGIAKKDTKDLGLEYPQKWYLQLGYWVFGNLGKIFLD